MRLFGSLTFLHETFHFSTHLKFPLVLAFLSSTDDFNELLISAIPYANFFLIHISIFR